MLLLLEQADLVYQPYTAICRGENASASDLWKCYELLKIYNPLYRGLYADQLERWFRVFHRSQVWNLLDKIVVELRNFIQAVTITRLTNISPLACKIITSVASPHSMLPARMQPPQLIASPPFALLNNHSRMFAAG